MIPMPTELFEFAFINATEQRLYDLASLAEPEQWGYQGDPNNRGLPILQSFIRYTYSRLVEEDKVLISAGGDNAVFNTGLATINQEPIFAFFDRNANEGRQPWHLSKWCREYDSELSIFDELPEMVHYFDDPSQLVFNCSKPLRVNVEHIVAGNRDRFPKSLSDLGEYTLQTSLSGAINNLLIRIRRNYKAAVPQYHRGKIQLLLPLCLIEPNKADLALVAEDQGSFYRASTCLTLEMAYNNARQLARPDRDWLAP